MTLQSPVPVLDPDTLRIPVEDLLDGFLKRKSDQGAASPELPDLSGPLVTFLASGGKRIRPVLALIGWHAAGGGGSLDAAVHLAASLELFHAFALIHDDVMDRSDTRRGHPTVHRVQAGQYLGRPHLGWKPPTAPTGDRFGEGAAILIGDLALIWSQELLHDGLTPAQQAVVAPHLDLMRAEVVMGQYLDLLNSGRPDSLEAALTVVRYKTAKYTIERPLHLGAVLAGAGLEFLDALTAYAVPLGEAFQLRDDILGTFGDPEATGKPALDDLREGKNTVLITLTLQHTSSSQAALLRRFLGRPGLTEGQADEIRTVIETSGARQRVETMIEERHREALTALNSTLLPKPVSEVLTQLADQAVWRTS